MTAYVIASYDVVDPERYEAYPPGVGPLVAKHGGELIVGDFDAKPLEGEKRGVYVVLRFESEEAALNWYNDPDYAPVRQIRLDSTANGNAVLVKQFVPPSA
ncbi:MAG TPA: DUF1330 domain-containing protein [Alphaproteobacteria bacterium]|nr:DUF1330 domain-containing protein [Alphaproteobacteria bacterium]